jgi:adenylate cyclase
MDFSTVKRFSSITSWLKLKFKAANKWLLGCTILLIFVLQGIEVIQIPFIKKLDGFASDMRLRTTLPLGQDSRIAIADIDEKSLQVYGQWPWNRHHLATLMDTLFDYYQIRTLGFDMVFAEAAGTGFTDLYQQFSQHPDMQDQHKKALAFEALQDNHFAQSLENRAISSGILFQQNTPSQLNTLPHPIAELDIQTHLALNLPKPMGFTANQVIFQKASVAAGFFDNPVVDADGNFRRVPLLQSYQGLLYPSLALSVAKLALNNPELDIQLVEQGEYLAIESVQLGHRVIPTDSIGAVHIPFRGPQGSFAYLSIKDILNKTLPKDALFDKVILLGTSAPGLLDLRSTPVDEVMPGVEVHANIIAGILDQNIKHIPAYIIASQFLFYLTLGILLLVLPHFLAPLWTLVLCVVLALAYGKLNFILWENGLMFPLATPILIILSFFIFHMSWGFFVESKKKRAITQLFGQYVPPQLVNEMAKTPESISIEGQSKELTVLFSDVRNFTSISESISPHELTQLMNKILTPMTQAIYETRGTVDKYMGDAIMAFWGAPLSEPKQAYMAILCALDMQKRITQLNIDLKNDDALTGDIPHIAMGVGITTGVMSVGNMGSIYRMAYTVMGDAVNLGSRLEGLTKAYGAEILVSEASQKQAPEFLYRRIDKVQVKGKTEPITILEPMMHREQATQSDFKLAQLLDLSFEYYSQQDWENALKSLDEIIQIQQENYLHIAALFKERISEFQSSPPPTDWDGVFRHTSK